MISPKMKNVVLIIFLSVAAVASAQIKHLTESEPISGEKSLDVKIECVLANFQLEPGNRDEVFNVDIEYDPEKVEPMLEYEIENRIGYLKIASDKDNQIDAKDDENMKSTWKVAVNPHLPTALNMDFGVGEGKLQLGGLALTSVNISNGLASTELDVASRNTEAAGEINIETGLGEFRGKNLNNARFQHMKFECGLGKAIIDFHGDGLDRSYIDVSVGLGSATLIFPEKMGIRVAKDASFLSSVSLDSDFRDHGDYYYTSNWNEAEKQVRLNLEVGLGSISVERIE